jgi:glycosyltransferase domain-containing protein
MDEEMSLTIVLTLKGRDEFTLRWMKYMNEVVCPFKILIADGGESTNLENHLMNYQNYPNLDYVYLRYPYDSTLDDFYSKFVDVLSKVETSYVLLADNDDFYLIDKLPAMILFLDRNNDYVAARGLLVNFEVSSKERGSRAQVIGNSYSSSLIYAPSIESETSVERIATLCHGFPTFDYYSNWYSVIRTSTLLKTWKQLVTIPNKEMIVLEVLTHVMLFHAGKMKIFKYPFYLRPSNTSTFGDTLVLNNEFLERCLINNSLNGFSYAIDKFLNTKDASERDLILRLIAAWLEKFVSNIRRVNLQKGKYSTKLRAWILRKRFVGNSMRFMFNLLMLALKKREINAYLRVREIEPFILELNRKG